MEKHTHMPSRRQNLRIKRLIFCKCLTCNKMIGCIQFYWMTWEGGKVIRGCLISITESFDRGINKI